VASTITAATSIKTTSAISNALHAHTSTSNTCRVTHRDRVGGEAGRIRPMDSIQHWHTQELDEDEEEFISVVKIEDAYFIKTSLHPLRPDRGIRRSNRLKDFNETDNDNYKVSKKDKEKKGDTKTDHLAKFTYSLDPSSRADLMNYKMSRKDKKYSETYYERVKRKHKNLEVPITTITTVSHLRKPVEDARTHHMHTSYMEAAEEWTNYKQKILKFASVKKDSILLQKIREKSKRRKRLAPEPSMKKRTSKRETFNGNLAENEKTGAKKENEKLSLKMSSLGNKSDYQIQEKSNKNDTDFISKRKESAIRCDETKQNCPSGRDNNYLDKKKNISKNINDEQINNRGGFKGIFANSYRGKAENIEDRIVHEGISKFNRQANERFKKYKNESPKFDCKSYDGNSYFCEEESSFDIKKTNSKVVNRDKLLSTIKREEFISSCFDDIRNRNSDVLKCSVFERVKNFEKIKMDVRDKTKNARREVHLDNLNYGNEINAIKQKFALPVNEIRLNQEEKIVLKGRLINIDVNKRQTFKSLSSGHCDDLSSFNSEFGMLKPNVSFLHTYRKMRSFT